jgi:DNA-binding response OmpR family regulator
MNGKVLVFSVHEPFRSLLLNSLKGSGFRQVAATGQVEEARQILPEGDFEALVVDLDAGEDIQQA